MKDEGKVERENEEGEKGNWTPHAHIGLTYRP